jgi:cyclophilin family peptidyl-prolyl cis-trans isomerase
MKEQQASRAQTREKSTRLAIIVVGAIVGVIGIAFIANTFIGDDESSSDTGASGDTLPAASVECPPEDGTDEVTQSFDAPPPMCLDPDLDYTALVSTNKGDITIALDQDRAPQTVNNFVFLARNRYFDDTTCHRIVTDFVVQCGDPDGTGRGGPGYQIADELPQEGEYRLGSIAMANSGPNTNGSQFFIISGPNGEALPPQYSLFGEVTDGYEPTVVEITKAASPSGEPAEPIQIESVTISTS